MRTLYNQVLGTGTENTGGKPNGHTDMNQHVDGQPHRCLEESATLLHGGLDTSRQVTSKKKTRRSCQKPDGGFRDADSK